MSRTGLFVVVSLRLATAGIAVAILVAGLLDPTGYWTYGIAAVLAAIAVWPNARVMLALWAGVAGLVVGAAVTIRLSQPVGFAVAFGLAAAGVTAVVATAPFGLKRPRRRRGAAAVTAGRVERAPSPLLEPPEA